MSALSASPVRTRRRLLALLLPLLVVLPGTGTASAAAAPLEQCNGILNEGGQTVRCTVTVVNTLDAATGVGSASVTVQRCTGAVDAPTCDAPVTTTYQDVVTSVSQCNGSASGGGGEVACTVDVVNDVTGGATPTAATVDQCVGSADGSGTMVCDPAGSTSGATVTQCNGSGNGGGSTVTCTVAPSTRSASLLVTVDQCNGSANGGGSLVTCEASITNNAITAPTASPTPTASSTVSPTVAPATPSDLGPSVSPVATGTPGGVAVRPVSDDADGPALPDTGRSAGTPALLGALAVAVGAGMVLLVGGPARGRHAR
ncbi:MAG TPA: hypothetical protein VGX28_13290 [Frankiaceae bacterium]|jgi:hypothetical protein|nr:hypothetical protein [Frankiaceae bacterium]